MKENNKKLIIYFTYTNHTKMIADKIQQKLNAVDPPKQKEKPHYVTHSTWYNLNYTIKLVKTEQELGLTVKRSI